ncbi:MAG: hypothetical protein Q7U04_08825 [Bacteriovorax sp.]|nr:hypothetical protein [Bacteriovorax sp.]
MHHIVFVCKGNICRSAFAEFYLRKLLLDKNIKIDSCGLDVDQGTQSPQDAVLVAREFEVDLSDHISKGLPACDLQKADLIVTMEFSQYLRLITKIPEYKKKTFILSEFAPWPACLMCNIYDPFGLGEDEFRRCFQKTKFSLDRLKNLISISQI